MLGRRKLAALALVMAAATSGLLILQPGRQAVAETPQVGLQQLPSVADLAERLLPAVVEISVSGKAGAEQAGPLPELPDNSPFKDFFDDFMKRQQGPGGTAPERRVNSMGSGFVVDASGIIVTNNHVVADADIIDVHFNDSTTLRAELVGRDPKTDLAVLRVKSDKPLATIAFGDSDSLRIGDWVIAIGNPFGLGGSVSLGIVSARNRDINAGPYDDFIQTDAAINKGNSGGPLFNLKGEVVGVNTAIYSPSGGSVGIGFSVPANTAKNVVLQLQKYGETRRGWLGVKIQSITDELAESMNLGTAKGALIADVTKDGPAAKAGIEAGDVVTSFNGRAINEMKDLPRLVADTEIGSKIKVTLLRKGKQVEVEAEIGRLEDGEKLMMQASGDPAAPAVAKVLGMTLSSITDELKTKYQIADEIKGAVITEVVADSIAAEKRLEPGDVVTEAGEKPVVGASDVQKAVDEATKAGKNSVLMLVAKGGKQGDMRFIALKVKN
jgi:serine protease Do